MILSARTIAITVFAVFLPLALTSNVKAEEGRAGLAKAFESSSSAPTASLFDVPVWHSAMGGAMPHGSGENRNMPRLELFLGYSYLRGMPSYDAENRLVWLHGGSASLAYRLTHRVALVGDFGAYTNSQMRIAGGYSGTVDVDNSNIAALSYLVGPRFSILKQGRVSPFAQALFGVVHANQVTLRNCTSNCTLLPSDNVFAMTAGIGLDLRVKPHFSVRLIQAEYLMTRFASYTTNATGTQNDMRLSSGIVFRFGGRHSSSLPAPQPLAYSCSVHPESAFSGDSIAVSGTAVNLDPMKTAVYTWFADGGRISGESDRASIDTKDAQPGAYMLKGHVSQGDKPSENADCVVPYTVNPFMPPSISCLADPAIVISGQPSTITSVAVSPQNWPLTYSYSTSSGSISNNGATATLSTGGAAVGVIEVSCSVADGKGQGAAAKTTVAVMAPVAAPKPLSSELCTIHFDRDAQRPSRVDNEAKACLDEIALSLLRAPYARLALVGNATSTEKDANKVAANRAINTRAYLVNEKGLDASRIAVYIGSRNDRTVSTTLIPAEAIMDTAGKTRLD